MLKEVHIQLADNSLQAGYGGDPAIWGRISGIPAGL